jgi:hypothetical protein
MNSIRAVSGPFSPLSTAVRSHIAVQRRQLAASATSSLNCFAFMFDEIVDTFENRIIDLPLDLN